MSDEPRLVPVPGAPKGCVFDHDGLCALHGTLLRDHGAIVTHEYMTLAEAKRRFPDRAWATLDSKGGSGG